MAPADDDVFTTWSKDLSATAVCIYLCGELDASGVPAFVSEMRGVTAGTKNVVMDAHLLSYIDSTGIGALFSVKQALERKGQAMCLVGCHGLLSKILDMTRLGMKVKCYETVDDALAAFESTGWIAADK